MRKLFLLAVLCTIVFTPTFYAQTQPTMLDRAEIVGVENEFFNSNNYLGIKVRNPFSYEVVAVVELHKTNIFDNGNWGGVADIILLKKYVVLSPREEYEIETGVYISKSCASCVLSSYADNGSSSYSNYYYTTIKAYKASVFQ